MKKEKIKERQKKKEELKQLENMFKYDENGKKRSRVEINKMILDNLNADIKSSNNNIEQVGKKGKYNYKAIPEVYYEGEGDEKVKVERIVETDF